MSNYQGVETSDDFVKDEMMAHFLSEIRTCWQLAPGESNDDCVSVPLTTWKMIKQLALLGSSQVDEAVKLTQSLCADGSLELRSHHQDTLNIMPSDHERISCEIFNRVVQVIKTFAKRNASSIDAVVVGEPDHKSVRVNTRPNKAAFSELPLQFYDICYYLRPDTELRHISVWAGLNIYEIYKEICSHIDNATAHSNEHKRNVLDINRIRVRHLLNRDPDMWVLIEDLNKPISEMGMMDKPTLQFEETCQYDNLDNLCNIPATISCCNPEMSARGHVGEHDAQMEINSFPHTSSLNPVCGQTNIFADKIASDQSEPSDSKTNTIDSDEMTFDTSEEFQKHYSFITTKITKSPIKSAGRSIKTSYRGQHGLKNLGNTCYMNSSLQCLSNIPDFRDFFLQLQPEDIQLVRSFNPAGSHRQCVTRRSAVVRGDLTEAYSNLMKELWAEDRGTCDPSPVRSIIARIAHRFAGCSQHDSQEFMCVLLDSLHEDLRNTISRETNGNSPFNRKIAPSTVRLKTNEELKVIQDEIDKMSNDPTIKDSILAELFNQIHTRNGHSFVMQTFQGQIKSTVQCLSCYHYSRTFDPFLFLCLPLGDDRIGQHKLVNASGRGGCYNSRMTSHPPHGSSGKRPHCSYTYTAHPCVGQAQIIVFGMLVTMDGLIHPIAVCVPSKRSEPSASSSACMTCSKSEDSTSSSFTSNVKTGGSSENNAALTTCANDNNVNDISEESTNNNNSSSSNNNNNNFQAEKEFVTESDQSIGNVPESTSNVDTTTDSNGYLNIDVSDLIAAAEESTIFLKTKSYHAVPRLELLEAVQSDYGFQEDIMSDVDKHTYFRKVPTYISVEGMISDLGNSHESGELNSDAENWSLDSNAIDELNLNSRMCNLKVGVVLCQFPPSANKCNTIPMSTKHAIVTLRVEGGGHIYPLAMSYQSLNLFFPQNSTDHNNAATRLTRSTSSFGTLPTSSSENSVITLARRGLQCLDFGLSATTCHITRVFAKSSLIDKLEGNDSDYVLYLYAGFDPCSITRIHNKRKHFHHLSATTLANKFAIPTIFTL